MAKKIYVGGISYSETDESLRELFGQYGTVNSAMVIMDRDTGRSKGFGFVEMATDAEGNAAIQALSGQQVNGRSLTVNEARPREDKPRGGGGYGGGYGKKRY